VTGVTKATAEKYRKKSDENENLANFIGAANFFKKKGAKENGRKSNSIEGKRNSVR
jgi:ABC-type Fe3+/spermidine/putrescine transport system ATPase subunit